jgi:hypothetical protein
VNHEPVSFVIGWLKAQPSLAGIASRISSLLSESAQLPAVAVVNATGAPVADPGGIDTVYDWTVTIYCIAGRTGVGSDYPDYQAAHQVASNIVTAVRASSHVSTSGARLVDAEVVAMTRATDDAGNAVITLTVDLRIAD